MSRSIRVKGPLSPVERLELIEASGQIGYLYWATISETDINDLLGYLQNGLRDVVGKELATMIGASRKGMVKFSGNRELRRLKETAKQVMEVLVHKKMPSLYVPEIERSFGIRYGLGGSVEPVMRQDQVNLRVLVDAKLEMTAPVGKIVGKKLVWDHHGYRANRSHIRLKDKFLGCEVFEGRFVSANKIFGSDLIKLVKGCDAAIRAQDILEIG